MAELAPGVEKEATLRAAGFNDSEVEQWKTETARDLQNAGFGSPEVDDYFGYKNPDMKPTKALIQSNFAQAQKAESESAAPKQAKTFLEALEAGWQMSVTGLIKNQKKPDTVLPEDAPRFYRIASGVANLAGDIPAMLAGSVAGGAAIAPAALASGPAAPLVEAAGVGYGTFAAPAAMRKILMDHYEKGDIQTFGDFWDRAAGTFIEANKQGIIGAATAGVGGVVGKVAAPVLKPAVKTAAQLSSEVATMVTVGNALEGKLPNADEFIDAAILVGGLHASTSVAGKLRNTYATTGVRPDEVFMRSKSDPLVQQDLLVLGNRPPEKLLQENGIPIGGELGQTKGGEPKALSATDGAKGPPSEKQSNLTEAQQKVLSQVGVQEKAKGESFTKEKLYEDIVDKLDPLKRADELVSKGETLKADESANILARMANDAPKKAQYMVEHATIDFKTLEDVGKPYDKIVEPHKGDQGFDAYVIAKRALELESKDKTSGIDVEAARQVVKEGKSKYDTAAKELVEFSNHFIKYAKDAGLLSEESAKNFVEGNKAYLPFKRIFDPEADGAKPGSGKLPGSFKELVGSEKQIQNPFQSVLENVQAITKAAEKNRAAKTFVDKTLSDPNQTFLKPTEQRGRLKENQFTVYRDGKLETYEIADLGIARAFKALDGNPTAQNLFYRIAKDITTFKKIGITAVPDFIMRNLFRDQVTAGVFSKTGSLPFTDVFAAMKDVWKESPDYIRWQKSGGAGGMFLDFNRDVIDKRIFDLNKETGFIDATWNVVKKPMDFIAAMGSLAEESTRLAEFKRVSKGASSGTQLFEAGYAAREITLDFSRSGAKTAAFNGITAFMNVQIQGLDKTLRTFKEDPVGASAKAAALITVPSILLWYANKDDERYKEIPDWQKNTFWIIPVDWWRDADPAEAQGLPDYLVRNKGGKTQINKGPIFRVPKPQELGILFGSMVERSLDAFFTENPHAYKGFGEAIKNMIVPSLTPDVVAPVMEQYFNKGLFTETKIVPGYLEKVAPQYQYSDYTSETAKQISKMLGYVPGTGVDKAGELSVESPMVVDNYIRSWGGNLGQYAVRILDKGLQASGLTPDPVRASDTLADIPFVKAFVVRYPSAGSKSIQDFYDNVGHQEQVFSTIDLLRKSGDLIALDKEASKFLSGEEIGARFKGAQSSMSTMSAAIRRINKDTEIPRDEKRQLIDGIYYQMITTSKQINSMIDAMKREAKKGENK